MLCLHFSVQVHGHRHGGEPCKHLESIALPFTQECVQEASELFLSLEKFLPALKARGPDAVGHGQVQRAFLRMNSSVPQLVYFMNSMLNF